MTIINRRQALAQLGIATSAFAVGTRANSAAEEQSLAPAWRHLEEVATSGRGISEEYRSWVESHAGYIADLLEKNDGGTWRTVVDIEKGFVRVLKDFPTAGDRS